MVYQFDWSIIWTNPYFKWLVIGFIKTIEIGILSWIIALPLGIVIGALRSLPNKLGRVIGTVYVEFFRNIPLLVQLFFWFYVIPPLLGTWFSRSHNLEWYCAIFGLGIYTASRVAEHVRSGFSSVPIGQRFAALSTGLSQFQMFRYVIIPYGFRIMIPPLTTEFITIFKNSALAMTIGILELSGISWRINEYTFHGFEASTAAIIGYLIIGFIIIFSMGKVEKRLRVPGLVGRE